MGHPCCGIFRCREPLQNQRHRFCKEHMDHEDICSIVGCERPVYSVQTTSSTQENAKVKKKKTCSLAEHQEIEKKHFERSTGSFLYKARLQHAEISHPVDSFSTMQHVPEQDIEEDFETYITLGNNQGVCIHTEKNTGTIGTLDESVVDSVSAEPCPSKSVETGISQE